MYLLAVVENSIPKGEDACRHLRERGAGPVTLLRGVELDHALGFSRDKQVAHGDTWVLWREGPAAPGEPGPDDVSRWVGSLMGDGSVPADA